MSNLFKLEPLNNGKLLEGLFKYQRNLVDNYIKLDRLPKLPLGVNNRENQRFLKKTIGNLNEELAEASEQIDKAIELMVSNNYTEPEIQDKMKVHLKAAVVEMVDALHFMVELMIYLNIEPEDIKTYYKTLLDEQHLMGFISEEPLRTTTNYSQHLNIHDEEARVARYNGFKLGGLDYDNIFALSKISPEIHSEVEKHFWRLSKTLLLGQNFLKMNDWRAEEVNASVQSFQNKLMEAWIVFFKLVDLVSLDDNLIYTAYEAKNLINQQRIINGY